MKIYLVGGAVRDSLLDIPSKDNDYVCECDFDTLRAFLNTISGVKIIHEKPEFLTMRVKKPDGEVVDFACCRSESDYDGRAPGTVLHTNLQTDLARRDFTVNAMAMEIDEDFKPTGQIIDPFGGQDHLKRKFLSFVGDPHDRIREDGLRWLRALRFQITRDFSLGPSTYAAVYEIGYDPLYRVSVDRIRDELYKCFKADTKRTLSVLNEVPSYWLKSPLWIAPTLEEK